MKVLLAAFLFISLSATAQKKDSVTYLPDSVKTISIKDFDESLKFLEDKITKKQYDDAFNYYKIVLLGIKTKDTLKNIPDSVNVVSVKNFNETLKLIEDKVTKKQYDEAITYYNVVLQLTEKKRKIVKK